MTIKTIINYLLLTISSPGGPTRENKNLSFLGGVFVVLAI